MTITELEALLSSRTGRIVTIGPLQSGATDHFPRKRLIMDGKHVDFKWSPEQFEESLRLGESQDTRHLEDALLDAIVYHLLNTTEME